MGIGFHLKSFNLVYFHILENNKQVIELFYLIGEKLYEIKILEETHKQEISRLQKRLQWYAENQELLDKDALRLREANEEIEKLRLEVMDHFRMYFFSRCILLSVISVLCNLLSLHHYSELLIKIAGLLLDI